VRRDVNVTNNPGLATILSGHLASNALALSESVDVVGIGSVKGDLGVNPL
jgi:tRNA A37 threonylcarbamoyltransferase TsaD